MDIGTFCLACHGSRHLPLAFHVYFSCSSKEPMSSLCHLYTAHPADCKQVSSAIIPGFKKRPWFWCDLLNLPTMLHQWFTCVHLLDTYFANLTEGFQLSFTTHLFLSEQQSGLQSAPACRMPWVCHHLFRSYDRSLSNIANIRLHSVSGHTHRAKVQNFI